MRLADRYAVPFTLSPAIKCRIGRYRPGTLPSTSARSVYLPAILMALRAVRPSRAERQLVVELRLKSVEQAASVGSLAPVQDSPAGGRDCISAGGVRWDRQLRPLMCLGRTNSEVGRSIELGGRWAR